MTPDIVKEVGIAAAVIIGGFGLISWILKCSFDIKKEILRNAEEERKIFLDIIRAFQKSIDSNNQQLQESLKQSAEYIQATHAEHVKIIEVSNQILLQSIESRKESADTHQRQIVNLDEHYKILLRINGEKH